MSRRLWATISTPNCCVITVSVCRCQCIRSPWWAGTLHGTLASTTSTFMHFFLGVWDTLIQTKVTVTKSLLSPALFLEAWSSSCSHDFLYQHTEAWLVYGCWILTLNQRDSIYPQTNKENTASRLYTLHSSAMFCTPHPQLCLWHLLVVEQRWWAEDQAMPAPLVQLKLDSNYAVVYCLNLSSNSSATYISHDVTPNCLCFKVLIAWQTINLPLF